MKVLIACEESQIVCAAYRKKGHEAYSCDIIECSGGHPEWHIKNDVLKIINQEFYESDLSYGIHFTTMDGTPHFIKKWDMIIAHPPCTYISKAGARHMYPKAGELNEERFKKAIKAKEFFLQLWNAKCEKICIENPTPLRIVKLPKETQVIQPYYFNEPYSKRTLLWLKNLPKLIPTKIINEYKPYCPSNTSNFSKGKKGSIGAAYNARTRSKTFKGIAEAMADQWT